MSGFLKGYLAFVQIVHVPMHALEVNFILSRLRVEQKLNSLKTLLIYSHFEH
ncbi:hypothetical protein MXB_1840 [Myxobolus squamalis]|nr:hypothetical protein MXB_1840 [Myxobolus squamalis]